MPESSLHTTADPNGATANGSFLAKWQATLASLESSAVGDEPSLSGDASSNAKELPLRKSVPREQAREPVKSLPTAVSSSKVPGGSSTELSAKLARPQQLTATRVAPSTLAPAATDAVYDEHSTRTAGFRASQAAHGTIIPAFGGSDSFHPGSSSVEGISAAQASAGPAIGNVPLGGSPSGLRTGSSHAKFIEDSTGTALSSGFATQKGGLAVSEAKAQSNPVAASVHAGDFGDGGSPSEPNTAASQAVTVSRIQDEQLGALSARSNSLSAPEYGPGGESVEGLQQTDADSVEPDNATTKRLAPGSGITSERSTHPAQPNVHASGVAGEAVHDAHGTQLALGNPAQPALPPSTGISANGQFAFGAASGSGSGSASGAVPGSVARAAGTSAGETFAALDGDASGGSVNWTHTGLHHAEAGFEDPSLGWVSVRADSGGGTVHASLVPGSSEAAQMLGSHLSGLNEYLAERHLSVGTLTVAGLENSGQSSNAQAGSGNNPGHESGSQSFSEQDSGGNSGIGHSDAPSRLAESNPISRVAEEAAETSRSKSGDSVLNLTAGTRSGSNGGYISVMA